MTEGWWNLGRDLQTSKYPLPPINIFDSSKLCSEFVQMFIFISCKYSPTARGEGISFKRFTSHLLHDIHFISIYGVMICPLGKGQATKSEKCQMGGEVIFNPKIYIADFGNFKQGFLSMILIKNAKN